MNLHEYQAKALLQQAGLPVPKGRVAATELSAREAANAIGGNNWYVKAQVLAGARAAGHFANSPGSEGGIRLCESPQSVGTVSGEMLGQTLFTVQTGPGGAVVNEVYIEEKIDAAVESYLAILVDQSGVIVVLTSAVGGVSIEQQSSAKPDTLNRWPIASDCVADVDTLASIVDSFGYPLAVRAACIDLLQNLLQSFKKNDCTMIEINPLVVDRNDQLYALDANIALDDNALYRQPLLRDLRDTRGLQAGELAALNHGFNYFHLDGDIGCMTSGAGMAMATMDAIKNAGGSPANFLDVPPTAEVNQFVEGLSIVLADDSVNVVLVNIFGGGILRCDDVADAIILALEKTQYKKSVLVRLAGANSQSGLQKLALSPYKILQAYDMLACARKAVELSSDGGQQRPGLQGSNRQGSDQQGSDQQGSDQKSSDKHRAESSRSKRKWWKKIPLLTTDD